MIIATDEELISSEMQASGRDLVNTAVKLINGNMNYLKQAGRRSGVKEPLAEYMCADERDLESRMTPPITDNQ